MQTTCSLHLWRVTCRSRGDHPQADRERGADPPTQIWKLVSQGGHLCCMCITLTDRLSWGCSYTERQGSSTPTTHRYRVWHETFSSCRDRHTDCHETVCSYTGRQGSSTPTTHRYRVWHETFSSYRDSRTHRQAWDCLFLHRQTEFQYSHYTQI